jgi:TonB family protein
MLCVVSSAGVGAQRTDGPVYDEDVHVISYTEMRYPRIAMSARVQGVVVVRATLDAEGNVVTATALSGSKLLTEGAAQNTKQWRFKPNARKEAIVVYEYRIEQGDCLDDTRMMFVLRSPNFVLISSCQGPITG